MEDIAPHCASEKIMEKLVKQEDDEKIAWWRKIIATIYNKVRFSIKSNKQGEYSEFGSEALSAGNIVDPTKTTIIAPPQKAVAMKELPVEDFIASEGNIFDDKK